MTSVVPRRLLSIAVVILLGTGTTVSRGQHVESSGHGPADWADILGAEAPGSNILGISCSGQDETLRLQAAVDRLAGSQLRIPPHCTIAASHLRIPRQGIRISGAGPSSRLVQLRAASTRNFIEVVGEGVNLTIDHLTIDGNEIGDRRWKSSSVFFASGGSEERPSVLQIHDVVFQNGRFADIWFGADDSLRRQIVVRNSSFIGGEEGDERYAPRSVNLVGPHEATIIGNFFDLRRRPQLAGRAGIVAYSPNLRSPSVGKVIVSHNHLVNLGRSQSKSTLGAIDYYNIADQVIVSNNRISEPWGRGISVRADGKSIVIANNVVNGLHQGPLSSVDLGSQIGVFATPNPSIGQNYAIIGNVLNGSVANGITIDGRSEAGIVANLVVSGNVISKARRRALQLQHIRNLTVVGNSIEGPSDEGIFAMAIQGVAAIKNNTIASVATGIQIRRGEAEAEYAIVANSIERSTTYGIALNGVGAFISQNTINVPGRYAFKLKQTTEPTLIVGNVVSKASKLLEREHGAKVWVDGSALSSIQMDDLFADIEGDSLYVWMKEHYVRGEPSKVVRSIVGVPEEAELTLAAAPQAYLELAEMGDNFELRRRFVSTSPDVYITLRNRLGKLVEVSRREK